MATAGPSFDALRERADRGDAEAAFQLAAYYGSGQAWQSGIPRDESIAARYYQRACDGGHQQAAYSIGMCFHTGSGVEKDLAKAVENYRIAAGKGHLDAQKALVTCYASGNGCQPDAVMAARYCRLAAEQGDADMMFATAERFQSGDGFAKDMEKSFHFYKMAERAGHEGAKAFMADTGRKKFVLERPWGCSWQADAEN